MNTLRNAIVLAAVGVVLITCAFDASRLRAQASRTVRFATATVTPQEQGFPVSQFTLAERRFTSKGAPLIKLIEYAYETSMPAIEGKVPVQPFFDIDASSAAAATPGQVREMLRNLLAERFALRTHVQPRQMSVFKIVVGSGGHRLRPATARGIAGPSGNKLAAGHIVHYHSSGAWHFSASSVTVPELARWFANDRSVSKPVIDATGIRGTFDVAVVCSTATGTAAATAVAQELGLTLEPATAQVDVLVIDGFKMP